jgi:hypothetical protein
MNIVVLDTMWKVICVLQISATAALEWLHSVPTALSPAMKLALIVGLGMILPTVFVN